VKLDHVQLAIPPGGEELARSFYVEALGLEEVEKPKELSDRGGLWLQSGDVHVHLGVDPDFHPAKKAHPAFRCTEYEALLLRLQRHDVELAREDRTVDGAPHCYLNDCFGNRIELISC
jgi:catechol 2,3-dioxygenase-like lactoylglutathione lyase family enzyme